MVVSAVGLTAIGTAQLGKLSDYDVKWATPSADATGSMPIGNGEVVLNVWVEAGTGDLLLLIGRTDSFSEISRILKLGQVRVKLSPSPFLGKDFGQHLELGKGQINIKGSGENLKVFVDTDQDVVHISGTLKTARMVEVKLENWRTAPRPLPAAEKESGWTVQNAPFPLLESVDHVLPMNSNQEIAWYHHNETSVVSKIWENQSLTGLPGTYDPLTGLTFGGKVTGRGLILSDATTLKSPSASKSVQVAIVAHTASSKANWISETALIQKASPLKSAEARTQAWWKQFWNRSHIFIKEKATKSSVPDNQHSIRVGKDSGGGNVFPGQIQNPQVSVSKSGQLGPPELGNARGVKFLHLKATVTPIELRPGRIFDKLTAGVNDGFLFDNHPGNSLRFIVGDIELSAPEVLQKGKAQVAEAIFDGDTGKVQILLDGKVVAEHKQEEGSLITRGYILQRYVQACQGRGNYPIKFNGGYFTVNPTPFRKDTNHDYRKWGDCFWFQNVRHMYHPMLASGDTDLMDPFFALYEKARPLAESRTRLYHGARGAYFPETMTAFGTYSGGDYGWNREGLQPKDVQSPWWDDAWNQGPELIALMLDRWDYTQDRKFLRERLVPMAKSILTYFDTRFKKDSNGKIILDPTQVVETYWEGVINDMPTVAGLAATTERLVKLPAGAISEEDRTFFSKIQQSCPPLPLQDSPAGRELAPAEQYAKKISNVENGELYAVWPFKNVHLGNPVLLPEAKVAYKNRKNRLDNGWGYDGNVAALLGLTEEAARILNIKVRNSHASYRWPATWGPNFDWLPDQNHGGNLLNTTQLMLIQSDSLELGGKIRILPSWPKDWDVSFKLKAAGNTTVECTYLNGKVTSLKVTPKTREKDVVLPE